MSISRLMDCNNMVKKKKNNWDEKEEEVPFCLERIHFQDHVDVCTSNKKLKSI